MSTQQQPIDITNPSMERRREPRYPIGAEAVLHRRGEDTSYAAVTLNSGTAGILLKVNGTNPFNVGDEVVCEVALKDAPERAFASWGVGRVVRIDESNAAVELQAAVFASDE